MRIAMLSYSYHDNDNRVRRYAETLALEGHHVESICLRGKDQRRNDSISGVHVTRIQARVRDEKRPWHYLAKIILFMIRASVLITLRHMRNRYDMIHVHNMPDFLVFAGLVPKILGCKIILDIHDIVPELYASKFSIPKESWIFKLLCFKEKISAQFADHVIVANHLWADRVVKRSITKDKCTTIMNYPDEKMFYERPIVNKNVRQVFIYPGSMSYHQGLDIAIRAFALIDGRYPGSEIHLSIQNMSKSIQNSGR
ncbi:MAG: glycosyltransferase, partial [Syntrophales bacterium LBB04]|nr:glycosyltransferase [Syntrophales bacterium LBB04]